MEILIKVIQLILALSILVLVHELGHFFFARLFKIRVDKFYLFFDIKFSLFKFKPKNSNTEYGIGWLPLGGYCKISGMIDESLDKEAMKAEPQPWEFRSKPAWQRLLVMFGGVLFNFILAILIYAGTLFTWGEEYIKNSDAIYGIYASELAQDVGFRHGDIILSFNDYTPEKFNHLQIDLVREQATYSRIIRNSDTILINIDKNYIPTILKKPGMFNLSIPFIIRSVSDSSLNKDLSLKNGDILKSINDIEIKGGILEAQDILLNHRSDSINTVFTRKAQDIAFNLAVDSLGRIGVNLQPNGGFINITKHKYNIGESINGGFNKAFERLGSYLQELKLIASPDTEAYKSVGSFITIGSIFPKSWNWQIFWNITAFLSVMLAVLNLLPIPALDGGHIVFTLYEILTGRKPSDKFLEITQVIGMLILFALMILAFGNDIARLLN